MYPNSEQPGVVIDQNEVILTGHIYDVAQQWLPELKRSTKRISLPDANEQGEVYLDLDITDRVASFGAIALDQIQRQIRVDSSEFEGCAKLRTENGEALAQDLDAKITEEFDDAIRIKRFICGLRAAGEQSRAQVSRSIKQA